MFTTAACISAVAWPLMAAASSVRVLPVPKSKVSAPRVAVTWPGTTVSAVAVIVPEMTERVAARATTLKLSVPGVAPLVVTAVAPGPATVALVAVKVVAATRASAAVRNASNRVLTLRYASAAVFSTETLP